MTSIIRSFFSVAFVFALISSNALADAAAPQAAESWLKLIDAGNMAGAYEAASAELQDNLSSEQFATATKAMTEPLGAFKSRKQKDVKEAPGDYVVVTYESAFENNATATETVTLKKGEDGSFQVSTYVVF